MTTLNFPPKTITRVLLAIVACLTVLSVVGRLAVITLAQDRPSWSLRLFDDLFDLDSEKTIPTWYASSTLLICSFLLWAIAIARERLRDRRALHWKGLAIIFLGLSIDEMAEIHERATALGRILHVGGMFYFAWVIPGIVLVAFLGLVYLRFLLELPRATRRLFVLAGGLFVLGTIGLELVGASYVDRGREFVLAYKSDLTYTAISTVEEVLEMLGIVVFIRALMQRLATDVGSLQIRFSDEEPG